MDERDPTSYTDKPAAGPQDRADDFTGPPVTAAEVALLQEMALIGADLARDAATRAKAKRDEAAAKAKDPAAAKAAAAAFSQEPVQSSDDIVIVEPAIGDDIEEPAAPPAAVSAANSSPAAATPETAAQPGVSAMPQGPPPR